jgi:hypothetical protein
MGSWVAVEECKHKTGKRSKLLNLLPLTHIIGTVLQRPRQPTSNNFLPSIESDLYSLSKFFRIIKLSGLCRVGL